MMWDYLLRDLQSAGFLLAGFFALLGISVFVLIYGSLVAAVVQYVREDRREKAFEEAKETREQLERAYALEWEGSE